MRHPFSRNTKAPKRHVLYGRWNNMKQFINNPNHRNYHCYGGRGIKMDRAWEKDFLVFLVWASNNGWRKDLILARKDKNKGFEPSNCFFANHSHEIE